MDLELPCERGNLTSQCSKFLLNHHLLKVLCMALVSVYHSGGQTQQFITNGEIETTHLVRTIYLHSHFNTENSGQHNHRDVNYLAFL